VLTFLRKLLIRQKQLLQRIREEYSAPRNYTTKNASAQEAHEAIRPTDFGVKAVGDAQQ
jgi:DNA topoisomerase-1